MYRKQAQNSVDEAFLTHVEGVLEEIAEHLFRLGTAVPFHERLPAGRLQQ